MNKKRSNNEENKMKKDKILGKSAILIIAISTLLITVGNASADPLAGEEGETQSMIIIGCALAMGIAGIGSAMGLMLAGTSAVAVTGEKPELFGRCLVFQVLPMTQAVYGLLTAILLMMGAGLLGGSGADLTNPMLGISAIGIGLVVGLTGISAANQGMVASASISATARNPNVAARGIIYTVMPETIAIFGLLVGILLMTGLGLL
jgi:V/A-type H+-transporting ATPase subunit K